MQEQLRFVKRGDYSIPLPDNVVVNAKGEALGFWAWVIANPKVAVILTEGVKKARM
jgi:hypothetical protein